MAYTLNALGQPTQVSAQDVATVNVASAISYFPDGSIKGFTYGNGMVHTATQNVRGLPSRLTDCTASGTCASANRRLDLEYAYDANGNTGAITDQVTGAKQTRAMTYDARDRLTQTTSNMFGTAGYGYDALDNLTTVNVSGGSSIRNHHYCYSNNRLATVRTGSCSGSIVQSLSYDVQGNLTSKGSQTFSFDYGNRLREISGVANYLYDGHGLRVRSTSSGAAPYIYGMYDQGGKLRWQRDEVANQRLRHIYLGDRLLAEHRKPIGTNTETIEYLHVDALGSPIARTNSSKTTIQSSEHEPYGLMVNRANDNRPGFTGHVMDAGSGLIYMQQRYYEPGIGKFLSVDPVTAYSNSVGAFNRYRYANNNPYSFKDSDGRVVQYAFSNGATIGEGGAVLGHWLKSETLRSDIVQIAGSDQIYTISFNRGEGFGYDADSRTLNIDVTSGLKVKSSGEIQSPALGGGHELTHAAEHDRVGTEVFKESLTRPQTSTITNGELHISVGIAPEEARATKVESKAAKELGEPARQNYHDAAGSVKACSPTSNEAC